MGLKAFVENMKVGIAYEAGAGISPNDVPNDVTGSKGSIVVTAKIVAPAGAEVAELGSSPALASRILSQVDVLPGIQSASTGPRRLSALSVQVQDTRGLVQVNDRDVEVGHLRQSKETSTAYMICLGAGILGA